MKYILVILISLTTFVVGIFYYSNRAPYVVHESSLDVDQPESSQCVIAITNITIPQLTLDMTHTCSFCVQEVFLSPTTSAITGNHVQGSIFDTDQMVGTFVADYLHFYQEENEIIFPKHVEITYAGITIVGNDALYDVAKGHCTIKKQVQVSHDLGVLSADSAMIDTHQQTVVFEGGVTSDFFIKK